MSQIVSTWDGLLIVTGDININLLDKEDNITRQYMDILKGFNLTNYITKPSRTTRTSKSLIDHLISNSPSKVSYTDVLPWPTISDHDVPYATINMRITRFLPHYKFIRNEKNLNLQSYKEEFSALPLNIVYGLGCPDDMVTTLNSLVTECIERHAPLRRVKVTRPPAPWIADPEIRELQTQRNKLRKRAHESNDNNIWEAFRATRNTLKTKIRQAKKSFFDNAFSSKRPKEIWRTIHRVLNPSTMPLMADPDQLNSFFATTGERTLGKSSGDSVDDLLYLVNSLGDTYDARSSQ